MKVIGVTNSSKEGIKLLKSTRPEGIILDMELNKGEGTGLDFLTEFNNIQTEVKPLIFVVTKLESAKLYDYLHSSGVDYIFSKSKPDFDVEEILETFALLRATLYAKNNTIEYINAKEDYIKTMTDRIEIELDLIGIGRHLKGRKYLKQAIFYLLNPNDDINSEAVFTYLSRENKIAASSLSRAMQTAINNAWNSSPTDELKKYYTAKIHYSTGVPSPTELIYYYKEKIERFLNN